MKTVHLVEGMDYRVDSPEPTPDHHALAMEIMHRLQEMDEQADTDAEMKGVKLLRKLYLISMRSMPAYRLMLDMVGNKRVLSESIRELATNHLRKGGGETSKQDWYQKTHKQISVIKEVWPEVGSEMERLMQRRWPKEAGK